MTNPESTSYESPDAKDYRSELRSIPDVAAQQIAEERERVNDSWLAAYITRVAEAAGKLGMATEQGQMTTEEHQRASQLLDSLVQRVEELKPRYLSDSGEPPEELKAELLGRLDILMDDDQPEQAAA